MKKQPQEQKFLCPETWMLQLLLLWLTQKNIFYFTNSLPCIPSQRHRLPSFPMLTHNKLVTAWRAGHWCSQQASPHVCIRMQPTVCCPAWLSSAQLCGQPAMISHPASQYWLGVLEAYTKARREVTDCVLQRTLSLHSTQEGRQNFLAQEMETTTRAGSIWLDSLKR